MLNIIRIKQFIFLALIIGLACTLAWQIRNYMPGVLGAITLYILMRSYYFKLTVIKNWKKWLAAIVFIIITIIIFVVPITLLIQLLLPKLQAIAGNPEKIDGTLRVLTGKLQHYVPGVDTHSLRMQELTKKAASAIPTVLGATLDLVINTLLAFFLLYFMLIDGRKMERNIHSFLPLNGENVEHIWEATRVMVVSNAIGIPVLAAAQAFTAAVGYFIFGVEDPLLWAVITGMFSLFPVVGTTLIWVPISLLLFSQGHTWQGIGLLLYGGIVIVNFDHILRFTLLKKIGNVHPVITIMGVFVGVPLFGFMGFIFGPLLISYLLLLVEIYRVEFSRGNNNNEQIVSSTPPSSQTPGE
ncbi:MAG: AI-2E family transporter [Taibaiella sp.]|nr:AI-2E family transporter [Taibaiella sp.]